MAFEAEQMNHDFHWLLVLGGLKPGATIAQANRDVNDVARDIAAVYAKSNKGSKAQVGSRAHDFLERCQSY